MRPLRLFFALWVATASAPAVADAPRLVATTATLTVLGGEVERVPVAAGPARPAGSLDLAEGDRVRTGADGRALITFLDGTTMTVEPGSDVTVRRASLSRERADVGVLVTVGTVWARVASWLGSRGTVSIESHAYTATAHDGLIGGQTRPDGAFVCWTRAGTLRLLRARPAGWKRPSSPGSGRRPWRAARPWSSPSPSTAARSRWSSRGRCSHCS